MPAASSHRSGAVSPGPRTTADRRPAANPWRIDLRELGRRAGSMQEIDRTAAGPGRLAGRADRRARRAREVHAAAAAGVGDGGRAGHRRPRRPRRPGSCARCLEPIEDTPAARPSRSCTPTRAAPPRRPARRTRSAASRATSSTSSRSLRDTVVLNLPLAPVCTEDCAGLCVDCGQRLDDLPADHAHEVVDARWAGLAEKFGTPLLPRRAPPARSPPLRRTDRGCPEAEDFPLQHPLPPLDVEGHRADPVAVPEPRLR